MTIKEKIKQVLDDIIDQVDLPMLPIEEYQQIFDELGVEFLPEFMDTNGWQVDFWFDLKHNSKKYVLSGSLWYGHFNFKINE
jgi:hypothetical protein